MARPFVLLITADQWPGHLLGAVGHPAIQTPTLDALAKNGVLYTRAYSEHPVCIPARRSLMTGTSARRHGDRAFNPKGRMPDLPTLAQCFRDAGYQAYAVGKTHTYPQRDRIGFDDILVDDEGRTMYGVADDYDIYLADRGFAGRQFGHGMSNNGYQFRPWHLPEEVHPTVWATRMMTRTIKRRDPTRPAFWYLSYRHPHPPLVPLQAYLDLYRDAVIDEPLCGDWARDRAALPYNAQAVQARGDAYGRAQALAARRAFYALCTHIDHQIRSVIGTLREEGILDDTITCFTSDHGDMLGDHGMWAKQVLYENSAGIPMILMGRAGDERVGFDRRDGRLVCLQDVMPTLLDLCGIPVPDSVEGLSMVGGEKRDLLFGEFGDRGHCSRMIRDRNHKLIYYPVGNRIQLFDLEEDPRELRDLAEEPSQAGVRESLTLALISRLYGSDRDWVEADRLVGEPHRDFKPGPNRDLSSMRGDHFPQPPVVESAFMNFFPESE